jgi:SAM-dependent methyltransferase
MSSRPPESPAGGGASDLGRFAGTASYYARYRRPYPPEFFAEIVTRCGLDGQGRLLDLGCGSGQLALPLARHVAHVVGVDPEPEMLDEARRQAAGAGVVNARWLLGSSADLDTLRAALAPLRLVTIGRAFHWMQRDATLRALDSLVEPGGSLVIASDNELIWNTAGDWQAAVRAVVQRWLGTPRRASGALFTPPAELWEVVIARSPFGRFERYELAYQRSWDTEHILGYLYSTSYCSRQLLGERQPAFERELRATLAELNPADRFLDAVTLEAFFAWRA